MIHHGILLIVILICLALAYLSIKKSPSDAFTDLIPDSELQEEQRRNNLFSPLINLLNPQLALNTASNDKVKRATQTLNLEGGTPAEYQQKGITAPYEVPTEIPDSIKIAQKVCESVQARTFDPAICSNFENADFKKYCGITFDLKSTNSVGKSQGIGGLYIAPVARSSQLSAAHNKKISPEYIYSPTYGSSSPGTFVADKETCMKLAEEAYCKANHTFDSVYNCSQCYSSSDTSSPEFHRIDPAVEIMGPSLILTTNARLLRVTVAPVEGFQGKQATPPTDPNVKTVRLFGDGKPIKIDLPVLPEGSSFTIETLSESGVDTFVNLTDTDDSTITGENLFLAGFLQGPIKAGSGSYSMDIKYLIDQPGYQPRLNGMIDVAYNNSTVRCWSIRPDLNLAKKGTFSSKATIKIKCTMPFSFVSTSSDEASNCPTGPYITKQASAQFLKSDNCHKEGQKPGAYSPECLLPIFLGLGGNSAGTGYPKNEEAIAPILFDEKGVARTLNEIGDFLTSMSLRASTGLDDNKTQLTIEEWDKASMFMTGVSIKGPCDGPKSQDGPLSDKCIQFLYTDPATYSASSEYTSLGQDGENLYCRFEGRLSPTRPDGLELARSKGGIEAVKAFYQSVFAKANDNTMNNPTRRNDILDCYGIELKHQQPEVFLVMSKSGGLTQDQAKAVSTDFGPSYDVATSNQLDSVKQQGGSWRECGWTSDYGDTLQFDGKQCLMKSGGIYLYGNKPDPQQVPDKYSVIPFNQTTWSNPASD